MIDKGGEDRIKTLILSRAGDDRDEGFRLLESKYRYAVSAYLRRWAIRKGVFLSPEDLADLWQKTLLCTFIYLMKIGFDYEWSLLALLKRIAHARAVDLVRRRMRAGEYGPLDPDSFGEDYPNPNFDQIVEELEQCFQELSEKIQDVLRADVALFVQYHEWASLEELCLAMNLNAAAVKARRRRGRLQLRSCLKEKGYDV